LLTTEDKTALVNKFACCLVSKVDALITATDNGEDVRCLANEAILFDMYFDALVDYEENGQFLVKEGCDYTLAYAVGPFATPPIVFASIIAEEADGTETVIPIGVFVTSLQAYIPTLVDILNAYGIGVLASDISWAYDVATETGTLTIRRSLKPLKSASFSYIVGSFCDYDISLSVSSLFNPMFTGITINGALSSTAPINMITGAAAIQSFLDGLLLSPIIYTVALDSGTQYNASFQSLSTTSALQSVSIVLGTIPNIVPFVQSGCVPIPIVESIDFSDATSCTLRTTDESAGAGCGLDIDKIISCIKKLCSCCPEETGVIPCTNLIPDIYKDHIQLTCATAELCDYTIAETLDGNAPSAWTTAYFSSITINAVTYPAPGSPPGPAITDTVAIQAFLDSLGFGTITYSVVNTGSLIWDVVVSALANPNTFISVTFLFDGAPFIFQPSFSKGGCVSASSTGWTAGTPPALCTIASNSSPVNVPMVTCFSDPSFFWIEVTVTNYYSGDADIKIDGVTILNVSANGFYQVFFTPVSAGTLLQIVPNSFNGCISYPVFRSADVWINTGKSWIYDPDTGCFIHEPNGGTGNLSFGPVNLVQLGHQYTLTFSGSVLVGGPIGVSIGGESYQLGASGSFSQTFVAIADSPLILTMNSDADHIAICGLRLCEIGPEGAETVEQTFLVLGYRGSSYVDANGNPILIL